MSRRKLVESFVIPKESGKAFYVTRGQVLRVVEVDGPQTCDLNVWNSDNRHEHYSAGRTRFFTGAHPRKGDCLWSKPPWERPMMKIVEDTVEHVTGPMNEASHDIEFPRCSPIVFEYPFGQRNVTSCQENLAAAIGRFGLEPWDVHDTCNLFMRTGVDSSGHIFIAEPDAKQGDYVDLLLYLNCLVAISTCPAGRIHGTQAINRPLKIEIYDAEG